MTRNIHKLHDNWYFFAIFKGKQKQTTFTNNYITGQEYLSYS